MALETTEDMALSLKKRARRRLVGSIVLVILLLVILPNVLKNRVNGNQSDINVTMPESLTSSEELVADYQVFPDDAEDETVELADEISSIVEEGGSEVVKGVDSVIEGASAEVIIAKGDKLQDVLASQVKVKPVIEPEAKVVPVVPKAKLVVNKKTRAEVKKKVGASRYLVQLGVFSEPENVERLQAKITDAGFTSNASTIKTPKGEMIRLRVGSFVTREAAANALTKLKQNGLSGMVMTGD
jgi:DedD protein